MVRNSPLAENGCLAQLVERLTENQEVACSIQAAATIQFASIAQLVEHLSCKQEVVGSTPIAGSMNNILRDGEVVSRGSHNPKSPVRFWIALQI